MKLIPSCLVLILATPFTLTAAPDGYQLAWSDEFDGDALDTAKWAYRTDSKLWSTQTPDNVAVKDGHLHLLLRKQKANGKDYTGGGVISKKQFKYGYYEARFKVPPGAGWHTSFWLMFYDGSGATFGPDNMQEIDICEQDSVKPHRYALNLHNWKGKHRDFGPKHIETGDLSAGFHTWGCEFTPTHIRYYFEGKLVDERDATVLEHGPQSIWLTSIATPYGGTKAVDDSKLPAAAVFDYVRFYQKPVAADAD